MGTVFVPVKNAIGLGLANNQYNTTVFDEITTTRLRLEWTQLTEPGHADGMDGL